MKLCCDVLDILDLSFLPLVFVAVENSAVIPSADRIFEPLKRPLVVTVVMAYFQLPLHSLRVPLNVPLNLRNASLLHALFWLVVQMIANICMVGRSLKVVAE